MGFKVSDVSAGVAANLAVFDEDELDNEIEHNGPLGLSPAEYFGGPDIGGASGGKHHYDGEDRGHDHAAELSDTGNTVFNYSMRDRMDGDGGTANSIGYRNFSPLSAEDMDIAEKRRKEADERLHLILEHYEAAQRLAEIEARMHALERQIKDLEGKIEALDRAFEIGDDADINDDSLAGLAKRNQMRRSLREAGIDENEYFRADGTFDQDKWLRDQERNREIQRAYEDQVRRAYDEYHQLQVERERTLRENPELADKLQRQAAGDPQAQAEVQSLARTKDGFVDLSYTVINNSPNLGADAKVEALTQFGPQGHELQTDISVIAANASEGVSSEAAWDNMASLPGAGNDLPEQRVEVALRLPETLPELLSPALMNMPSGAPEIQVPNIRIIDTIPQNLRTSATSSGAERSTGSLAAELGFDTVDTGIKPITATFAQAVTNQTSVQQVAALDAEATLAAERQRLSGATGSGTTVSSPTGMMA